MPISGLQYARHVLGLCQIFAAIQNHYFMTRGRGERLRLKVNQVQLVPQDFQRRERVFAQQGDTENARHGPPNAWQNDSGTHKLVG